MKNNLGLPPSPDVDRIEFRRSLIGESLAAVAGFLTVYPSAYRRLMGEHDESGTSPELRAEALALAADIATVMQSLRSREEVIEAPLVEVDQLFSAFLLLAGDSSAGIPVEMLIDADDLDRSVHTAAVTAFLARTGTTSSEG